MASSDVDIASQALVMLGAGNISSFLAEESDKAETAGQLYPDIRASLIGEHPWRCFMTKSEQLAPTSTAPKSEWKNAFTIPPDIIGEPVALFTSANQGAIPDKEWEVFGGEILCNHASIWVDYKTIRAENQWPQYFVQMMIYECCWKFAEAITDDQAKFDSWFKVARGTANDNGKGGYFRIAAQIDSRGSQSQAIQDFSLIDARMG